MFWSIENLECGAKGLEFCGWAKEIAIQNFSIVKPLKRFRKNSILVIWDLTERWLNQKKDIGQAFINYYTELFSSSNPSSQCGALEKIPQLVTEDMNADLVGVFHEWEILDAIKQMAPLKAPGLDGMPPLLDKDVTSSVHMWLNSGILPSPH